MGITKKRLKPHFSNFGTFKRFDIKMSTKLSFLLQFLNGIFNQREKNPKGGNPPF